jgi:AcrR family transcriptional regulator
LEKDDADRIRRLPAGVHGLPPELVARNQRERLIAAMAEVCAEQGYGETSIADVTRRAGVSTASFYKQFADKRECLLESFVELFGRFLAEVERVCAGEREPDAKVKAGIHTAASLLSSDLPSARLLTVEVAAVGVEGLQRQHEAIEHLAILLREALGRGSREAEDIPNAEWTMVAAMVALVTRRIADGKDPSVAELEGVLDFSGPI